MDELMKGTLAKLKGETPENKIFVHPLPFNLIPHIDKFQVQHHLKFFVFADQLYA